MKPACNHRLNPFPFVDRFSQFVGFQTQLHNLLPKHLLLFGEICTELLVTATKLLMLLGHCWHVDVKISQVLLELTIHSQYVLIIELLFVPETLACIDADIAAKSYTNNEYDIYE